MLEPETAQALAETAPDRAGPRLEVAIHVLADGTVVFGDLPRDLAEVARLLAGQAPLAPAEEQWDGESGEPLVGESK